MSTISELSEEDVEFQAGEYDVFIDQRLERTSFHLKTLDLITGLVWLGLVLFGSLLVLVLVDHWVIGLGLVARFCALACILVMTLYVGITRVLSPLFKSINPEYAALTVEQAHPELKNGLVNFLFFRERKTELRPGVFRGIEHQAATDLTVVPIDSAIDRSSIIKLGYCLVALAVVWVGYILLSPKSPFQTLQRVAMPWRDISRPSQVDIADVTPGDIEIYRGQSVEIEARIHGMKSDQLPSVVYSTLDGQFIDQQIELSGDQAANRFSGTLEMLGGGIQQDIVYQIRAGDALSKRYQVHVTDAPYILVDHVELDYPSYTGQADEVVQGEGDVRAIEGTRVTVVGKANQIIQRGNIQFVPSAESRNSSLKRASLKVQADAMEAHAQFSLRLNADRDDALYRAYHLQFTNDQGEQSVDPIEYAIEVVPDLRPVVQILTPDKRTVELPVNGSQKIEIRAVDPDFKLTRVQLAARTRGRNLFRKNLLATSRASEWHTGQFTASYRFVPKEFGLKEGDVVEYLAMAEDNKHASNQSQLDPNRTITAKQFIRIVKADPLAEPKDARSQEESGQRGDNTQEPKADPNQENQEQKDSQSQQGEKQENQEGGEYNGQEQQEKGSESEAGEDGDEQEPGESEGGESGLQQDSNSGGDSEEKSSGGSPGESSESNPDEQSPGDSAGDKPADPNGQGTGDESGDDQNNSPSENGGGASSDAGGNSSGNEEGDTGESQEENAGAGERGGSTEEQEPLPSTGERDGEVVDRIREHLKEKGELDEKERQQEEQGGGDSNDQQEGDASDSNSQDPEGTTGETDKQTESDSGETRASDDSQGGGTEPENSAKEPQDAGGSPSERESQETGDGSSGEKENAGGGAPADQSKGDDEKSGEGDSASQDNQPDSGTPGTKPSKDQSENGEATEQGDSENATGDRVDPAESKTPSDSEPGDPSTDSQESTDPSTGESSDADKPDADAGSESNGEKKSAEPAADSNDNERTSDQPNSSDSSSGKANGKSSQSKSSSESKNSTTSNPSGGSDAGDGEYVDDLDPNDAATGDDANLEYARKATDLVLEYLRDQKQEPDQELLDKLGWKQDDVDKFIRRWDKMKRNAKGNDQVSQQNKSKLDELLKGMGLKSPASNMRRSVDQNDSQRNNRNTGRKRKVPTELLGPFRAFQRGLQQK